jgi:Tetracyclin repressor-like, C-terminal domain
VRESVAAQQRAWLQLLERLAGEAEELGELPRGTDAAQLAFELHALLVAANTSFILRGMGVRSRGRGARFARAFMSRLAHLLGRHDRQHRRRRRPPRSVSAPAG